MEAISQYLSIIGLTLQVGGFVSKFFSPDGQLCRCRFLVQEVDAGPPGS